MLFPRSRSLLTFIQFFTLLFHLQDLSSRNVIFSFQLSVIFDLGLCGCLCGSTLEKEQTSINMTIEWTESAQWYSLCPSYATFGD